MYMNKLKFTISKEELENFFSKGLTISQISKQTGHPYMTIQWWVKKWKLQSPKFGYIFKEGKMYKKCSSCDTLKEVNNENFPMKKRNGVVRKRGGFDRYTMSACRECLRKRTFDRHVTFKLNCVNYRGGKCEKCGYNKCISALDFHHKNPEEKDYDISSFRHKHWSLVKPELDKCDLLCRNCHAELHFYQRENAFICG
jgi:hypothetical protein